MNISLLATDIALITQEATALPTGGGAWTGIGYIIQVTLSLSIIVALIFVTLKFLLPKLATSPKGRMIQVVDRVGLEPAVSAYVLKVGRQGFLVVSSAKNVAYIDKVDIPENIDLGGTPK